MPDFQIQNLTEAFPPGNSSSLILSPDFISRGTLPTLFPSIQYIYPDTNFNSDSTLTPSFVEQSMKVFLVSRCDAELAQLARLHLDPIPTIFCALHGAASRHPAPPPHAITPSAQIDGGSSVAEDHAVHRLLPRLEHPHPAACSPEPDHS